MTTFLRAACGKTWNQRIGIAVLIVLLFAGNEVLQWEHIGKLDGRQRFESEEMTRIVDVLSTTIDVLEYHAESHDRVVEWVRSISTSDQITKAEITVLFHELNMSNPFAGEREFYSKLEASRR